MRLLSLVTTAACIGTDFFMVHGFSVTPTFFAFNMAALTGLTAAALWPRNPKPQPK